jgi:hypothetical protein
MESKVNRWKNKSLSVNGARVAAFGHLMISGAGQLAPMGVTVNA